MKTTHCPQMKRALERGRMPRRGMAPGGRRVKVAKSGSRMRSLLLGTLVGLGGVAGAVDVAFEHDVYSVSAGQSLEVRVLIDYETHTPQSLFSYGMRMTASPQTGVSVTGIEVPPELDFNLLTGTAAKDLSPGVWSVTGHVSIAALPSSYYTGSLLATYTVQFSEPGTYTLGLDLNRTAGPSEEVFIDGDGVTLDGELTPMGTTQVVVGEFEPPILTLAEAVSPAGAIDLEFQTSNGVSYILRTSTDLAGWTNLLTFVGDGTVRSYQHLGGALDNERFYQVGWSHPSP